MIFTKPVPFEEAIDSRKVKTILPTTASTSQLKTIAPALRERAVFSARVTNYRFLEFMDGALGRMISPETVIDPATGARRAALPGEAMDAATFRVEARKVLDAIDYKPEAGKEGTLQDLRSTVRLDVISDTNVKMAHGYGNWQQGQDTAILDQWPAQELFRAESRDTPRDWSARWTGAGGQLFGGRMIALKNAPIWTAISAFGLPYPPFDFRSGMDVRDIDRDEAMQVGLIDGDTQIQPETRNFNDDVEMSAPKKKTALYDALAKSLGTSAEITPSGALRIK